MNIQFHVYYSSFLYLIKLFSNTLWLKNNLKSHIILKKLKIIMFSKIEFHE